MELKKNNQDFQDVNSYLSYISGSVRKVIENHILLKHLAPDYFSEGVMLYPRRSGKALRPSLVYAASEIMGSNPLAALTVGAAIEMFHIFTLVHDDIIDRDDLRRGGPTNHVFFVNEMQKVPYLSTDIIPHLGSSLAILAGDVEHAFSVCLITRAAREGSLPLDLAMYLIEELELGVLTPLVEGQVLDLQLSQMPLDEVTESAIMDMLWKKTGVLFQFSCMAGAMIGLGTADPQAPFVKLFAKIGKLFGIAFQLRDDLLGLIGDEKVFGKPIGSDLQEGKRTPIVIHSYQNADEHDRTIIKKLLGNPELTESQLVELRDILIKNGGIRHATERIEELLSECSKLIRELPEHPLREILTQIVAFAGSRNK